MKKNDYIYIYDNNFGSLLLLIKELWKNKIIPLNIKDENYEPNLFDKVINLEIKKDEKEFKNFIYTLGKEIYKTLYYVYLSNVDNKELLMFYFLGYSLKYKDEVFYYRNILVIDKVLKTVKFVNNENHKLKGFIRFKELSNHVLFAEISPVNNVLILLARHFQNRLKNEFWIIKDVKRKILAFYDKNKFYLINEDKLIMEDKLSDAEEKIEDLWKSFYKTIGINMRKNSKCRMNFMPKRYWKHMLEMEDEM